MHNVDLVLSKGIILRDDQAVRIEAKSNVTPWEYISYLVTCMVCDKDNSKRVKNTRYTITVHDDISGLLDGPYFQIQRLTTSLQQLTSVDFYEPGIMVTAVSLHASGTPST